MVDHSSPPSARLELRISILEAGRDEDVVVEATGATKLGDIFSGAGLSDGAGRAVLCERSGLVLSCDAELSDSEVRWGDRLVLIPKPGEPTRVGSRAVAELVVTSGPCAGKRWELGPGSYELGRDPGCEIQIDDRSLSRRHLLLDVGDGLVSATDLGSTNGSSINGVALTSQVVRPLQAGEELEAGRSLIRCGFLKPTDAGRPQAVDGRIAFNRPPRVTPPPDRFLRQLPSPPVPARKLRLPLAASLLPLGAGIVLFVVLNSAIMLAIAALSPLMAIGSYVTERRGGKKSFARDSAEFSQRLLRAIAELDGALVEEGQQRRRDAPDAGTLLQQARDVSSELWERRPADPDFLRLRVGIADLPARSQLDIGEGGDEALRDFAVAELASRQLVPSVPMLVDCDNVDVVGLAGSRTETSSLARWLVIQAAILHSPSDLVIVAALPDAAESDWGWLKWLPHVRPARTGLSGAIATGASGAELMLAELRDIAARRRQSRRATQGQPPFTHILVVLDERTNVDRGLVSAALSGAGEVGLTTVWLGSERRNLPGLANTILEVPAASASATVTDVQTGDRAEDVSLDGISVELAEQAARLLAPVQDISATVHTGDLPSQIGLLDLLKLSPPSAQELERRWRNWKGEAGLAVGVGVDGLVVFNLRRDGPHALIAGTTGSGKSELLRTFVASAAASAPPDKLSFLLVDYKGGAAFAPCAELPHVVDVVSDLDEHLAERALVSLEAELKRRERVLADHGARDLAELERRLADECPPVLVIAVDEFAKLREEVPEFVDGVVDIAQRGRSLGVHMVLAAQSLRNAFTPAIRANTNLRVALRVAEESESEDIIGSPAAARVPSGDDFRGRAFVRTGHGELREFQTAYVSGRTLHPKQGLVSVRPFPLVETQSPAAGSRRSPDSDRDSDLAALAVEAKAAQGAMRITRIKKPWLPALPALLSLDALGELPPGSPSVAAIGLVDLPHLQRQDPLVIDLEAIGNAAIFGAGKSGKTTVLTTVALALARSSPVDELRVYGLDAYGGPLSELEALPHCGGVIQAYDAERVERLLRELLRVIEQHRTRSGPPARRTLLLLDDLGAFAQQYDRPGFDSPYEQLQRVLTGGKAAGIHVVLSASRRGALPAALAAGMGLRLVLRMPTQEDMLSLGLDAKSVRGARLPPGRGFTQDNREFQIAVPTADGEIAPLEQVARQILPPSGRSATRLGILPSEVRREAIDPAQTVCAIPVGLADENLGTATVDLSEMHFLVIGPYRSGRSTALRTLAAGVRAAEPDALMTLLSVRRSPLRELEGWDEVASTGEACIEVLRNAIEQVESSADGAKPRFVFVDDGGELSEALVLTMLERLVRLGRDAPVRFVAAVETAAARGIGLAWIRELRKEGHGLLLQPDLSSDGDLLAVRLPRRVASPMHVGRGFLVQRGTAALVQVAG